MRLSAFCERLGTGSKGYSAFARLSGLPAERIRRYCLPIDHRDRSIPKPRDMVEIYRVTGGQVTPNDFYDLPELERAKAAA